jgi:hypothetical protein
MVRLAAFGWLLLTLIIVFVTLVAAAVNIDARFLLVLAVGTGLLGSALLLRPGTATLVASAVVAALLGAIGMVGIASPNQAMPTMNVVLAVVAFATCAVSVRTLMLLRRDLLYWAVTPAVMLRAPEQPDALRAGNRSV